MRRNDPERSTLAFAFALCAGALLLASLGAPWYRFETIQGRSSVREGSEGSESHAITIRPFSHEGDIAPVDAGRAELVETILGVGILVCLALLVATMASDLLGTRVVPRRIALAATSAVLMIDLTLLAVAWKGLAASMGLATPFHYVLQDESGYVKSELLVGWFLAATAAPAAILSWVTKYAAGSFEQVAVEVQHAT